MSIFIPGGTIMKHYFIVTILLISIFTVGIVFSEPSFNGATPGCSGGDCHSFKSGLVSAKALDNFQIEVTLSGIGSGDKVAGELVDIN
jgi:hypothetical protein